MGIDLRRKKDGISVSVFTWARAYALATEGGWEPRGTLPPKHLSRAAKEKWEGAYDSNDGQIIRDEDARAMADALEKMLANLGPLPADNGAQPEGDTHLFGGYDQPQDYFNPESKRKVLQALIRFLHGGACEIL